MALQMHAVFSNQLLRDKICDKIESVGDAARISAISTRLNLSTTRRYWSNLHCLSIYQYPDRYYLVNGSLMQNHVAYHLIRWLLCRLHRQLTSLHLSSPLNAQEFPTSHRLWQEEVSIIKELICAFHLRLTALEVSGTFASYGPQLHFEYGTSLQVLIIRRQIHYPDATGDVCRGLRSFMLSASIGSKLQRLKTLLLENFDEEDYQLMAIMICRNATLLNVTTLAATGVAVAHTRVDFIARWLQTFSGQPRALNLSFGSNGAGLSIAQLCERVKNVIRPEYGQLRCRWMRDGMLFSLGNRHIRLRLRFT